MHGYGNVYISDICPINVELIDKRLTSNIAFQTMIDSGISKKARQNKALIDQISATIILQNYLEWRR